MAGEYILYDIHCISYRVPADNWAQTNANRPLLVKFGALFRPTNNQSFLRPANYFYKLI